MPQKKSHSGSSNESSIFRSGDDFHFNACVGNNSGVDALHNYASGFFRGGFAILEKVLSGGLYRDSLVHPASFNFRHGIELYLKRILWQILVLEGKKEKYPKSGHSIEKLWNSCEPHLLRCVGTLIDPEDFSSARSIVIDFAKVDPGGQVFRYPWNLKKNRHLATIDVINCRLLGEAMEKLFNILDCWFFQFEQVLSNPEDPND